MKLFSNVVLAGSLVATGVVNAGVIGKAGSNPYLSGDVLNGASKLVLTSGDAVINVDDKSSVIVTEKPLVLNLKSGSACVNLGESKVLDITDPIGNIASFSANNAAAVAATLKDGALHYKEVVACKAFAYANSTGIVSPATGVATTATGAGATGYAGNLLPLLGVVGIAAIIASDDDDDAPAASPAQ